MSATSNARLVIAALILGVAGTASGNFAGTDVVIPSLGHGPGNAGAQWYACIWVHNPNAVAVSVTFRLLLRDQANPAPQAYTEMIPAGDTRRYDDALATLFGVTAKTFGAVRVTTPAGQPVIVNARSYNKPAGTEDKDTTGQFYAAIPAVFAIGPGQTTQLLGVYQTTPQDASQFRYNYGFVETSGSQVTVRVTAYDEAGSPVGSPKSYTLGGYQASQYNITDLLPQVSATNLRLEVAVTSGPGQVVAFGSGVSNRANDPSTFEMGFRDELLAANSPGGGLTSVAHDGSLAGDGTTGAPLGIANGGVSKGKLSASGGTDGQVLGTDGSGLVWQNAAGLTLPYSATVSVSGTAFQVTNNSGAGIRADVPNGNAIIGTSSATNYAAVYGSNPNGYGVYGIATGMTNAGTFGKNTHGAGVFGTTTYGFGVEGGASNAGGVGVWGYNFSGGSALAGSFSGRVEVDGSFSVSGTKAFAIDHPLDPENRELWHAAVESSEVLDVYSGNVVTGADGTAVVQLPEWFQALNTDFRYQLTCIGAFGQAIVEREIADNRFTIRTSIGNVKVSWQVTARRNDAVIRAHPFEAEREKPASERGSYISPAEHGQPKERGVAWARHPEAMRRIEAERERGPRP